MDRQLGASLRERAFRFACAVGREALKVRLPTSFRLTDQLLRSSAAIGANLEEAKAASSRREFIRLCEISLREARESVYWIRVCVELKLLPPAAELLRKEGQEIANIIAVIVIKTKRRLVAETTARTSTAAGGAPDDPI